MTKRFVIHKEKTLRERIANVRHRERSREDFWALKGISLEIPAGETFGLMGANGSGKSTLLKVIGGIIQPTSGSVGVQGRVAALLELGAGFHPDLTGRENVYLNSSILGLSQKQTDRYFDAMVDFSGIEEFIDTQVKFYSSGMYVRLAFAVAVHVDPEVLLVDEVLAVGDEPFQAKCLDKIRSFQAEGRTILLVNHSADTIGQYCTRAAVLSHGELVYEGEPAEAIRVLRDGYAEEETARLEAELAEEAEAQEDDGEEHQPTARETAAIHPVVTGVELRIADGQPVPRAIAPGDSLQLELVVDTRGTELENWNLGIAFDTPLGHRVFGTSTEANGYEHPEPFTGRRRFRFDFPDLRLGTGRYHVVVALQSLDRGAIHRLPVAARFDVEDDARSKNVGDVSVLTSVAHEDLG